MKKQAGRTDVPRTPCGRQQDRQKQAFRQALFAFCRLAKMKKQEVNIFLMLAHILKTGYEGIVILNLQRNTATLFFRKKEHYLW